MVNSDAILYDDYKLSYQKTKNEIIALSVWCLYPLFASHRYRTCCTYTPLPRIEFTSPRVSVRFHLSSPPLWSTSQTDFNNVEDRISLYRRIKWSDNIPIFLLDSSFHFFWSQLISSEIPLLRRLILVLIELALGAIKFQDVTDEFNYVTYLQYEQNYPEKKENK